MLTSNSPVIRALGGAVQLVRREPAMVVAVIDAVLVLAVTLGLPLTAGGKASVDAVLVAISGLVVRSQVVPVVTVQGQQRPPVG